MRESNVYILLSVHEGYAQASGLRSFLGGTPRCYPEVRSPRQESDCCYAAGGKPLTVMQEDFLVTFNLDI